MLLKVAENGVTKAESAPFQTYPTCALEPLPVFDLDKHVVFGRSTIIAFSTSSTILHWHKTLRIFSLGALG